MSPRAFTLLLDSLTPDTQTARAIVAQGSDGRSWLQDPPRNASNRQSGVYVAPGIGRRTRMSAGPDRHQHVICGNTEPTRTNGSSQATLVQPRRMLRSAPSSPVQCTNSTPITELISTSGNSRP